MFRGTGSHLYWMDGNIDADPLFLDPNASDFRLQLASPAIDAASNAYVLNDFADLDRDGDRGEITPLDLDYKGRYFNEPRIADTGCGPYPVPDMGAYELGGTGPQPCPGDLNDDSTVGLADIQLVLAYYGLPDGYDLDCDGDSDFDDLAVALRLYGMECPQ